jgi:hypothetical protein
LARALSPGFYILPILFNLATPVGQALDLAWSQNVQFLSLDVGKKELSSIT